LVRFPSLLYGVIVDLESTVLIYTQNDHLVFC